MEWPFTLNVPALLADGWRPAPFEECTVKIYSRCDLPCDYCYMYEMADQSWRSQPKRMSVEIAEATAQRIGQHARDHGLRKLALILHGGEPLLAGPELIWYLVDATRKAAGPEVHVTAHVQTNAVGLNDAFLRLFDELDVRVGVSLDGGPCEHNRHRRFASGRGSYTAVTAGLDRLRQPWFSHLFAGLLCTVDVRNDPIATYEALLAFAPPAIDFLLPHGTWDVPPRRGAPGNHRKLPTPTGSSPSSTAGTVTRGPAFAFESIIRLLLTGASSGETVGLAPSTMVVIEADGSIEQVDSLKAAYEGAAATGLHVIRNELDDALYRPGMVARQIGVRALAAECRRCPIQQVCGGGQYPHRYRSGSGFANPSVYCPDLMRLIEHIALVVRADIASRLDETR